MAARGVGWRGGGGGGAGVGPQLVSPAPGSRPRCPLEIRGLGRGRAPRDLGAGPRWAWQGRGRAGRGRAWPRARELTSSVAAESTGANRRAAPAGERGRARSRSPRGPDPRWGGALDLDGGGGRPCLRPLPHLPAAMGAWDPKAGTSPTSSAVPPLPSPSPQPEAPARGSGPRRNAEKQRDEAAAGPQGLWARPLLSPPRLPQGRRAPGRDARLPGAAEARSARSDATRIPGALGGGRLAFWS